MLQKDTFQDVKGILSDCKTHPFNTRKVSFHTSKSSGRTIKMLSSAYIQACLYHKKDGTAAVGIVVLDEPTAAVPSYIMLLFS